MCNRTHVAFFISHRTFRTRNLIYSLTLKLFIRSMYLKAAMGSFNHTIVDVFSNRKESDPLVPSRTGGRLFPIDHIPTYQIPLLTIKQRINELCISDASRRLDRYTLMLSGEPSLQTETSTMSSSRDASPEHIISGVVTFLPRGATSAPMITQDDQ